MKPKDGSDSYVMPAQSKNHQRFFLVFFPLGHLAVDWGGGAVLLLASAMAHAQGLAKLKTHAYAETKTRLRGRTIDYILETLDSDLATFGALG